MLKSNAEELLMDVSLGLTEIVESSLSQHDAVFKEKMEWLNQILVDAKENGFDRSKLMKTPLVAKRTRKQIRLSTIEEDDIVEVPMSPPPRCRMTRNAAKVAKGKLPTQEKSLSDDKPAKRRKKSRNTNSVKITEDSSIVCSRAIVLLTPVKIENQLTSAGDVNNQHHQKDNVLDVDSISTSEPSSVSPATAKLSKMQCTNALKIKVEDDTGRSISPSIGQSIVNTCSTAVEVLNTNYMVSRNQNVLNPSTTCSDKQDLTCSTSTKSQSIIQDGSLSSIQKLNTTFDIRSKGECVVEHLTAASQQFNATFDITAPNVTEMTNISGSSDTKDVGVETPKSTPESVLEGVLEITSAGDDVQFNEVLNEQGQTTPPHRVTRNYSKLHLATPDRVLDHFSSRKSRKRPALFSPYATESVRKRVAAYEKLKTDGITNGETVPEARMTRTKTRAAAAAAAAAAASTGNMATDNVIAPASTTQKGKSQVQKKEHKHDKEYIKKLAKKSFSRAVACARNGAKDKENSNMSAKNTHKQNLRTPLTASRILGQLNNLSTYSTKSNTEGKRGVIHTSIHTLINKGPLKSAMEEIEERKAEERKRREEKEAEVLLKKEELLREKIEAQKRIREEKMKKVHQARQAQEKEKLEQQRLLLEEKDQRMKLIMQEQEAKQKEVVNKKKLHTQQKNAEAEERRKLEEAARLARLKEQEEEQLQMQLVRKREQEEAERQRQKRLAEEKEATLLKEKAEQHAKAEVKTKEALAKGKKQMESKTKSVKNTPSKSVLGTGKLAILPKSLNDYGIDEVTSDDPSDSEDSPKKIVPKWARKSQRMHSQISQSCLPDELAVRFMSCTKSPVNPMHLFPTLTKLKRTSSALWLTPPLRSRMQF